MYSVYAKKNKKKMKYEKIHLKTLRKYISKKGFNKNKTYIQKKQHLYQTELNTYIVEIQIQVTDNLQK